MQTLPENLFYSGSALLVTILISGWIVIPILVQNQLDSQLVLENGTKLWEEWINDKQVNFSIYIFNVSNPAEIESGAEPIIHELGPYVYSKIMTRHVIEAATANDTVIYKDIYTYHFNEELSNGKEDDEIIILNLPFMAVAQQLSSLSSFTRYIALSYIMKFKSKVFVRRTVDEYLFKGTYEPMVHELEMLTDQDILPNSTFGIFYGMNGTDLGVMEVDSGKRDLFRVGQTMSWKGETQMDFWKDPYCNMMNGTDGTLFSSALPKDKILYLFSYDLCRSVELKYSGEVEYLGIQGYVFQTSLEFMMSAKESPNNRCYCLETDVEKCLGAGAYSIKSCRNDAPLVLSTAHFLGGDVDYAEKFGLHPEKNLHASLLVIEPILGAPLEVRKRVQVNAEVKRLPKVAQFKKIQDMIFPLIWIDESFSMDEEMIGVIQNMLFTPLKIFEIAKWFIVGCSLFLIVISAMICIARQRRKQLFV